MIDISHTIAIVIEGSPPSAEIDDAGTKVVIEDDCILRVDERWVSIPETQLPVARLLISPLGHLVSWSDIMASYQRAAGRHNHHSMRSMMHRLSQRFAAVDLEVRNVRGIGFRVHRATNSA
jgi:hypothetical protein